MLCQFLLYSKVHQLYTYICPLFLKTLFPYRALQSIEWSFLCYTVVLYCLFSTQQYEYVNTNLPVYPSPSLPSGNHHSLPGNEKDGASKRPRRSTTLIGGCSIPLTYRVPESSPNNNENRENYTLMALILKKIEAFSLCWPILDPSLLIVSVFLHNYLFLGQYYLYWKYYCLFPI